VGTWTGDPHFGGRSIGRWARLILGWLLVAIGAYGEYFAAFALWTACFSADCQNGTSGLTCGIAEAAGLMALGASLIPLGVGVALLRWRRHP
jgi:hypothetical protein